MNPSNNCILFIFCSIPGVYQTTNKHYGEGVANGSLRLCGDRYTEAPDILVCNGYFLIIFNSVRLHKNE